MERAGPAARGKRRIADELQPESAALQSLLLSAPPRIGGDGIGMAEYFLCLDADFFSQRIRPSLAESWRRRSFAPCRSLCREMLPAAEEYARRFHLAEETPFVARIAEGFPFDRSYWRQLTGEILLFAAVEIPEFPHVAETLCCLLAPQEQGDDRPPREHSSPIRQALCGSRDVSFGGAIYRPDRAGYNDRGDVARLADYLQGIQPDRWMPEDLSEMREVEADERADELAFAREWFPDLAAFYRRMTNERRVAVIESIY